MKNYLPLIVGFAAIISLNSCELAGDIFKGGFWTGIILVGLILIVLFYFFAKRK